MAAFPFGELVAPVSGEAPCGPDLEQLDDPAYLNFTASAEFLFPSSFFEFVRSSVDFEAQFATLGKLLSQSRDLRLLTIFAKLLVLNRDLDGFSGCIGAVAALLDARWDCLHPGVDERGPEARLAALHSLDDIPRVVLPLQYMPLLETQRHGPISYRSHMILAGEVSARPGEASLDAGTIEKEWMDADLDVVLGRRERLFALRSGLTKIGEISAAKAGFEHAVRFERLEPLVVKILAVLDGVIMKRNPTAILDAADPAVTGGAAEPGPTQGGTGAPAAAAKRVNSVEEAAAALAGVADYFSRFEPSSPALLLVRQAEQLIGKSFLDVMKILVPASVGQAAVQIGTDMAFSLPLERLSGSADSGEAPKKGEQLPATNGGAGAAAKPAAPVPEVRTRSEAVAFLEGVGLFYRAGEPSSPIPLLTDRARSLAERDFLYLLQHLLPEGAALTTITR